MRNRIRACAPALALFALVPAAAVAQTAACPTEPDKVLTLKIQEPALVLDVAPRLPSDQPIALHVTFPPGSVPAADTVFHAAATLGSPNKPEDRTKSLPVQSWKLADDKKSGDILLGAVPNGSLGTFSPLRLVVVACLANPVSGETTATVAEYWHSAFFAGLFTAALVTLAALTLKLPDGVSRQERFNPIWAAQDGTGRASLSSMQIIFFSVIVLFLVIDILLRTGILANLSNDVLGLLGIAGIGSVGGKFATNQTHKLSFDNWAWAKRKGWTNAEGNHVSRPQWSDLYTTDDDFDPYKFQMLSFSFVIGVSLFLIGINGVAKFEIPQALLALIGLSQATYLGGKVVSAGSVGALDDKLSALRKAEEDFIAATAVAWDAANAPAAQLARAKAAQPALYMKFKTLAETTYEMFKELFVDRPPNPNLEPGP